MFTYLLIKLGGSLEWERSVKTLEHLFRGQSEAGFFYESSDVKGNFVKGIFSYEHSGDWVMIRKAADILYTPYAVAMYEATGEEKYKELGIQCEKVLAGRFVPEGNYIRAWGRMDNVIPDYVDAELAKDHFFTESEGPAIIDCMMNLPILFWAIYGFAIAYSYTKKQECLDTAVKISEQFVDHLEEDFVPIWDFRLPKEAPATGAGNCWNWDASDVENTKYNRDSSAAAIAVCGFHEILKHTANEKIGKAEDVIFESLSEKYTEKDMDVDGILRCQNGNMTYTGFGDYYFVEAYAMRTGDYKRLW